jgi:tetratricopeptide (TPR) repeat protein
MLKRLLGMSIAMSLFATPLLAENDAVKVYKKVSPSVVALKSLEGSGTGFVLEEDGLVLTNAHVVTSPLPYQIRVDVVKDGKLFPVIFKNVKIVGIHPKLDLALVRVDAKAVGVKLLKVEISTEKLIPGMSIFAIGNPGRGDGKTLEKTITLGIISGLDRHIEGVSYIQHSAAINPGNSGGPLLNSKGQIVGVNTLKGKQEGVGYAIPVAKFTKDVFVPLEKREKNDKRIQELLAYADKITKHIKEQRQVRKPEDKYFQYLRFLLVRTYTQALTHDPGNKVLYIKIGSALSHLGEPVIASAYLARGIALDPWNNHASYVDFGNSLTALGDKTMASLAYAEAIAKFPDDSDDTALLLARHFAKTKDNQSETAYYAKMAIAMGVIPRLQDEMEQLYKKAVRDLTDADRKVVETRVDDLEDKVKQMHKAARNAKADKTPFLTKEFGSFVKTYDAMRTQDKEKMAKHLWGKSDESDTTTYQAQVIDDTKAATVIVPENAEPSPLGGSGSTAAAGTTHADPATARKAITEGIEEAKKLVSVRQKEKAVELLKKLIKSHPDHTSIDDAKKLLVIWDRKKTTPAPANDAAAKAIKRKIDLAKLYKRSNNNTIAVKSLKQIISLYPDHPDIAQAKTLLKAWEK